MNYYRILGISPDASHEEIKAAYKKLAQKYHPDKQGTGDAKLYAEINEAYRILGDSVSRGEYDKITANGEYRKAVEKLKEIIIGIIDNTEADLAGVDLVATMRVNIDGYRNALHKDIEEISGRIRKFNKAVIKIKRKKEGDNIFKIAIEGKIKALELTIEKIKDEINQANKMLEILENYEYDVQKFLTWPDSWCSPSY